MNPTDFDITAKKGALIAGSIGLAVISFSGACARHPVLTPRGMLVKDQSFLDLKRGDRLRIVFPFSMSGGAMPQATNEERHGSTITLTAPDLAGVEIVHYSISGNHGSLVRLRFVSAETMIDGKALPQTSSPHLPFRLPEQPGRLRLIYFVRISQSDHNMAVVSAPTLKMLDAFTNELMRNPATCGKRAEVFCSWVPSGVAVRPETARKAVR